jgi:hypothetical protein
MSISTKSSRHPYPEAAAQMFIIDAIHTALLEARDLIGSGPRGQCARPPPFAARGFGLGSAAVLPDNRGRPGVSSAWRLISFGSRVPPEYAEAAQNLARQCRSLGIDCFVPIIDFEGAERKRIVLYKPSFILEQLRENPEPTLWLDCDTALEALPSLPWEKEWDVGFLPNALRRKMPGVLRRLGGRSPRRDNPVSGFAVAFRPTERTFHFLEIWKYLCDWPDLASGGDHRRMCWAREMTELREVNIASHLQGTVVRDKGKAKEHDLRGLQKLHLR